MTVPRGGNAKDSFNQQPCFGKNVIFVGKNVILSILIDFLMFSIFMFSSLVVGLRRVI